MWEASRAAIILLFNFYNASLCIISVSILQNFACWSWEDWADMVHWGYGFCLCNGCTSAHRRCELLSAWGQQCQGSVTPLALLYFNVSPSIDNLLDLGPSSTIPDLVWRPARTENFSETWELSDLINICWSIILVCVPDKFVSWPCKLIFIEHNVTVRRRLWNQDTWI